MCFTLTDPKCNTLRSYFGTDNAPGAMQFAYFSSAATNFDCCGTGYAGFGSFARFGARVADDVTPVVVDDESAGFA